MSNLILEGLLTVLVFFSFLWMDNYILSLEKNACLGITYPWHPHTKARSSKTIRTIFQKLSDFVSNNITVTNLHFFLLFVAFGDPSIPLTKSMI